MSADVPTVDPPRDLDGFVTFYGIAVSVVGEAGHLMALGHHDRRRVLAAFEAFSRRVLHQPLNLVHDFSTVDVEAMWAELVGECGNCPPAGSACDRCQVVRDGNWWISWHKTAQPGSFPITMLEM